MSIATGWHPTAMQKSWPGVAIATVIALAATYVSSSYGGPQLLYALFFSLAFHFLSQDATCRPGIELCSKAVLRTGIALLGVFKQTTLLFHRIWAGESDESVTYLVQKQSTNDGWRPKFI